MPLHHLRGGAWIRGDGAALPLVPAEHADSLLDQWGVNIHSSYVISNADGGVYAQRNYAAILDLMSDLGVRIYRDVLRTSATSNGQRSFMSTASDKHGMRCSAVMGRRGGAPRFDAQSRSYREDLAAYVTANPGFFLQMEGYNEPNYVRGGRPTDWATQVVNHAKWVWNVSARISRSEGVHIPAASASLHNVSSTRLRDYRELAALGWANYCHRANIHCYPGPNRPSGLPGSNSDMAQRTRQAYTYGGFDPRTQPATNTESGYFTSWSGSGARGWIPYDVHATYIPKHLMAWRQLDRKAATPLGVLHQFYYELLDDPDASGTNREAGLGLVEVPNKRDPSTWKVKPAYTAMRRFLKAMADPGAPFTPADLPLTVSGDPDVQWRLYGKRNGTYQLVLWKDDQNIWTESGGYASIGSSEVTVQTAQGTETVRVGSDVVVHGLGTTDHLYAASGGEWLPLVVRRAERGNWV